MFFYTIKLNKLMGYITQFNNFVICFRLTAVEACSTKSKLPLPGKVYHWD